MHSENIHSANFFFMEISEKEADRLRHVLRQEMERRGLDERGFAPLLGISYPFLNQILNQKRKGSRQLVNFADRLKVPISYLLGRVKTPDPLPVPVVAFTVAGLTGHVPENLTDEWLYLSRHQARGRRDLVAVRLTHDADSMLPQLRPHDLVVIDREEREIIEHKVYAALLPDQESTAIKRLQRLPDNRHVLLVSDNPAHPAQAVLWHENLVLGRVIFSQTCWL